MIRSLWIAKTGMEGQQTKLDTVTNNLANVGTNGFKRAGVVFEDLMYQNLRQTGASNGQGTTAAHRPAGGPGRARRGHHAHFHPGR
jgi:flagellar basal-body rod protein FlgG